VGHSQETPFDHVLDPFVRDDSTEMASIYRAVVEATEEAVLNALFAATDTVGRDGHERRGLPLDEIGGILRDRGVLR
jgi:D-aminopeptidase